MTETYTIISALTSMGLIAIIVEAIKKAGFPDKFAPLLSLGLGQILGILLTCLVLKDPWYLGITYGLMLSGITSLSYDQIKKLRE